MPAAIPSPSPASPPSSQGSLIFPSPLTSKLPRALKSAPWRPNPGTHNTEWTRTNPSGDTSIWRVSIFFRRVDASSFTTQDSYSNASMLANIDPNNKHYRNGYNKWVGQFGRRWDGDYAQAKKAANTLWSGAERAALYAQVNAFCARDGVHRFGFDDGCGLSNKVMRGVAAAVSGVPNPERKIPRGIDAVRGQIGSARAGPNPKNRHVFEVLEKGRALRARLAKGEKLAASEMRPRAAIPLEDFPVDPAVAVGAGGKRKRAAAAEPFDSSDEDTSEDLSEPPADGDEEEGLPSLPLKKRLRPRV